MELGPAFSQLPDHSCDGCGFRGNVTQKPNLTFAFAVGDGTVRNSVRWAMMMKRRESSHGYRERTSGPAPG
ncbi:hypothetical protein CN150_35880, partial [Sinorhizobium meliloti]